MRRLGIVAVALVVVSLACEVETDPRLTDLEVGDCVESVGQDLYKLEPITCAPGRHQLRVTKKFMLSQSAWPGKDALHSAARQQCPRVTATYLAPGEKTWKDGKREVVCFDWVR